ncbi:MAG: hypothetical protein IKF36_05880 [Bacilli bacterium]|nr:hypothetical protein [Bacilli bacterium]
MKILLLSHESDIDGMGSVVLSKIVFGDIEYELFPNVDELELKVRKYIEDNYFDDFDTVYITDLSLLRPAIDMVNDNESLKKKIKIFDHHQRAIDDGLDKYDFSTVIERDELGNKTCATSIFYNYLVKNKYLDENDTLKEFCELTRLEDTWSWEEKGDFGFKAHDLAILFSAIGKEKYIEKMVNKIKNNSLDFDTEDLDNIINKKTEYENKVREYINDSIYLYDEDNNKFGITYAPYEYRNEITHKIINDGNKNDISYMIVVALDKGDFGQKSYRKVKDDFDVNEVAKKYGGGGHPGAAGVYITKDQNEKSSTMPKEDALKYLSTCSQ